MKKRKKEERAGRSRALSGSRLPLGRQSATSAFETLAIMAAEGLASAYFPDQESFLKALAQPLVIQTPLQVCWHIKQQFAPIPHALQLTKQSVGTWHWTHQMLWHAGCA